jgi:hypothetical protein
LIHERRGGPGSGGWGEAMEILNTKTSSKKIRPIETDLKKESSHRKPMKELF